MSIIEVTGNPRHDQLVHLIAERGYMNIEELAQLLDVSTPVSYTHLIWGLQQKVITPQQVKTAKGGRTGAPC